ncbi:hypothetical protein J3E74DRAFT_287990 [Bipolaris maydis]|nr:hypothetical protein J3E74DRAFT_287990 [Bipolaris maydis]
MSPLLNLSPTPPYFYGSGLWAFNENILTHLVGNISEAIQNLIMGYASIATFLKHYLSRRITVDTQAVERQRRRHALLKDVKEQWEFEQLVRDVERQLAGLETNDDLELVHDIMLPAQKKLCDSVLSKPGATIEEEVARRNCAIYAVTLYCGIEEGGMSPIRKGGRSRNAALPAKSQPGHEQELLELAKVSVYKEKRPRTRRDLSFQCVLELSHETDQNYTAYIEEPEQEDSEVIIIVIKNESMYCFQVAIAGTNTDVENAKAVCSQAILYRSTRDDPDLYHAVYDSLTHMVSFCRCSPSKEDIEGVSCYSMHREASKVTQWLKTYIVSNAEVLRG